MKKILAIWFALCLAVNILFGATLNWDTYINRFLSLPSFLDCFNGVVSAVRTLKVVFADPNFIDVVLSIGKMIYYVFKLPIDILIYVINVIIIILPVGLSPIS